MKKSIAFVLVLVCILGLIGCTSKADGTNSSVYKRFEFENVSKLIVISVDGKRYEVTNPDTVRIITENIESIQFEKGESSENTNGFGPFIQWYDADDNLIESISVMAEETIIYDRFFWTAIDGNIDYAALNQILGNVNQDTEKIETDTDEPSSLDGVTMEVTEYSDTSVTVRITNDTDMNIMCGGEDFCLKILDEETGEWRDLDTVIDDYGFFEEAYMIQKDSPYEMVIDFEWLYGKLKPGRYQIVKTVMDFRGTGDYTNYVYAAEFDISMEKAEYPDAGASMTSQKDISVASFWDREGDVLLSAEDAAVIADLVGSESWMEGTGDCLDDCIIFMDGEEIKYSSDCGTFNDTVNEKSLHLTEEQQAAVNAILEKYIALGDVPVTEEKPPQSVESSGTSQNGTIQDGKIYILGFGWVDYEGGGTEGIYAEDMYENGNKIGTMD